MDTKELHELAARHLVHHGLLSDIVPAEEGPILARAQGSLIWDTEGREYLDFNAGQMCSALGHNNPRVTRAINEAASTLTHASSVYYNVPQVRLAARIAEIVDPPLSRSLFIQSGADSNEVAVLLARRCTGRAGIGAFHLGFHGYSEQTRAMSFCAASPGYYGPSMPDIHAIPTPYAYRAEGAEDGDERWWRALLQTGLELLDVQCPGNLAGVIVEPLVSAGGCIELPPGFLAALRDGVHARGGLLILDEAQTGLAKLGAMFAYQQEGVVPDIMTLSKHFGGGMALSAVVTSDEIAAKATVGGMSFGHSHSSDPIACAAGLASLEEIVEEDLPARARAIGAAWRERIGDLQQRYPLIGDIRGRGTIQGVELVRDRATKEPASEQARAIVRAAIANGLLFSLRGPHGNVLRFVLPFTTTEAQIDRALGIVGDAIRDTGAG